MDSEKGLAIGIGIDAPGVGLIFYNSTFEESDPFLKKTKIAELTRFAVRKEPTGTAADTNSALEDFNYSRTARLEIDNMVSIEITSLCVSASIAADEGTNLTVSYSTY